MTCPNCGFVHEYARDRCPQCGLSGSMEPTNPSDGARLAVGCAVFPLAFFGSCLFVSNVSTDYSVGTTIGWIVGTIVVWKVDQVFVRRFLEKRRARMQSQLHKPTPSPEHNSGPNEQNPGDT